MTRTRVPDGGSEMQKTILITGCSSVGSIVGLFTTPFAAACCSSKAAVHSLTDALRMELKP